MKRARDLMPMIPQGVQCYFGEEVNRRRRVESTLAGIIKNWGFREIILPFFDYLEDFSYGLGSQLGRQSVPVPRPRRIASRAAPRPDHARGKDHRDPHVRPAAPDPALLLRRSLPAGARGRGQTEGVLPDRPGIDGDRGNLGRHRGHPHRDRLPFASGHHRFPSRARACRLFHGPTSPV